MKTRMIILISIILFYLAENVIILINLRNFIIGETTSFAIKIRQLLKSTNNKLITA